MMDFSFINELLKDGVVYIDTIVGGNEFAAGAIIAGFMGIITYLCRALPQQLFNKIVKHTTTSLELNSTNKSYHLLAAYLQDEGIADQSRHIKVGNGRYGDSKNVKELGYGSQVFWFNWYTPMLITSRKEDSTSQNIKEFITLKKIGRSHRLFNSMLKSIEAKATDATITKYYKYRDDYEYLIGTQLKRRMETIAIPKKDEERLYAAIDSFTVKEDWYIKHQIPYQLGILLYGPPGTGKTSLIKAIAAYMDKDVCYVDTELNLTNATTTVKNSIIVVEEVDTLALDKRDDSKDDKSLSSMDILMEPMNKMILGRVLNALDGIFTNHGRVLIMTTNHVEVLDPALLRPGRIDLQLEINHMCSETFNMLLERFFPDYEPQDIELKDDISPADVQNDVILGMKPGALIKKYSKSNVVELIHNRAALEQP